MKLNVLFLIVWFEYKEIFTYNNNDGVANPIFEN